MSVRGEGKREREKYPWRKRRGIKKSIGKKRFFEDAFCYAKRMNTIFRPQLR